MASLTPERATELAQRTEFVWHQRFELAPGVFTPGVSNVPFLLQMAGVPERLDGATVLDIGTTNGGAAFECERRGAERVVAVDIADADWFGFAVLRDALNSRVEHVQGSIYELPERLKEQFDLVLFWGVLYHLRHPLLALDNVRRLTRGTASIETAVCDFELDERRDQPLVCGSTAPMSSLRTPQLVRPNDRRAPTMVRLLRIGAHRNRGLAAWRARTSDGGHPNRTGRPRVRPHLLRAPAEHPRRAPRGRLRRLSRGGRAGQAAALAPMSVWLDLVVREAVFLVVLVALGSGPAAFLRVPRSARLALAPVFGLCVGCCASVTMVRFVSARHTGWAILALALASVALAVWDSRPVSGVFAPARSCSSR